MKVKELIEALRHMDQDAEVVCEYNEEYVDSDGHLEFRDTQRDVDEVTQQDGKVWLGLGNHITY